jgi:hypothetical protein
VGTIGDAVEQRLAEAVVGEDRRPLGERQVGDDDDGSLLGAIGDDLEEHLGSDVGQGSPHAILLCCSSSTLAASNASK